MWLNHMLSLSQLPLECKLPSYNAFFSISTFSALIEFLSSECTDLVMGAERKSSFFYSSSDIAGVQATGEAAKADRIWKESAEDLQAELLQAGVELWQIQLWPPGKVREPWDFFVSNLFLRMRSQLNWVQKGRILYGNETDVNEYPWQV